MECRPIAYDVAKPFIEEWHYSRCCPTGMNLYFGWYVDEELYAVADYGTGVNPYSAPYLARITEKPVSTDNLIELKRLCRVEPARKGLQLTWFLSRCHGMLRRSGFRYVVSYSDPAHGHSGGIYRAANFTHLGKTNAERHTVDKEGNSVHRRHYYRYARRNGLTMEEARQQLGLTVSKTPPKDRWFLCI